jgi:SlyX protein
MELSEHLSDNLLATRINKLESTMAFQDDLIDQLNTVVTEQSLKMTQMETQIRKIVEQITRLSEAMDEGTIDIKPPHY